MSQEINAPITDDETEICTKRELFKFRCTKFSKKFVLFSISHVGLVCLVISYSLLGAVIFKALESPNEKQSRMMIRELRNLTRTRLWNITTHMNVFTRANWSNIANNILKSYQEDIYKATKGIGWDGRDEEYRGELDWSFAGSLLYSVTVITTIGYGHITPKTVWGRIVTIFYAFLGIPLLLLCLTNLGSMMGNSVRMLYNKLPMPCKKGKTKFMYVKTKTPIRYTMKVSTKNSGKRKTEVVADGSETTAYKYIRRKVVPKQVPMIVCLLLVIAYNLFGTILFALWESEWDTLTAAYFCFITLSTIGFGDVVPGHSIKSWQSQSKQVICTLYLLFGLTLLAMCFELVQEQVRSLAKRLGTFFGILDVENEDNEHT